MTRYGLPSIEIACRSPKDALQRPGDPAKVTAPYFPIIEETPFRSRKRESRRVSPDASQAPERQFNPLILKEVMGADETRWRACALDK